MKTERVVQLSDLKKEKFIQVGRTRQRIANEHHAALVDLQADFPYSSMQELLFLTSFIGASLLQVCNPMKLISVRNGARAQE